VGCPTSAPFRFTPRPLSASRGKFSVDLISYKVGYKEIQSPENSSGCRISLKIDFFSRDSPQKTVLVVESLYNTFFKDI